jgi:uncharacterized protein YbgA (DUF1722 family)
MFHLIEAGEVSREQLMAEMRNMADSQETTNDTIHIYGHMVQYAPKIIIQKLIRVVEPPNRWYKSCNGFRDIQSFSRL